MTPQTLVFTSAGARCEAWHWPAATDGLTTAGGRPVMVMAHGLSCTKDCGLAPFAEAFAGIGLDVVAFDYRGFGGSEGNPRGMVSFDGQLADLDAAVDLARTLPGVDRDRVVLWGVSLGGGHVVCAAAERPEVAAVISVVPIVDGLAAARHALGSHGPARLLRSTASGAGSRLRTRAGRRPRTIPVVAQPGEVGAFTLPGAYDDMMAIAGPTWRNEIAADVVLELGSRKPYQAAKRIGCPWLVQIADLDRSAPPHSALKAAFRGRAEVRHYPADHFDLFPGKPWHEPAVRHALRFLARHLAVHATETAPEPTRV